MENESRLLVELEPEEPEEPGREGPAPEAAPARMPAAARAAFFALGLALSAAGVLASWLVGRSRSVGAAHEAAGAAAIGCILNAFALAGIAASELLSCTAAILD